METEKKTATGRRWPFVVAALAAALAVGWGIRLSRDNGSARGEAEKEETAMLAAARSGPAAAFERAWAAAAAAGGEPQIVMLRFQLERQFAGDFPGVLDLLARREASGLAAEGLTDWKLARAVNAETPDSDARHRRDGELRAWGIRLAHAASRDDLAAGHARGTFWYHRMACDLCAADDQAEMRRKIHAEFEAALRAWLDVRRATIAEAALSGDERRIQMAAGPAARILDSLRDHDARPGAASWWTSSPLPAFEEALAPVQRKRVVLLITGNEPSAQRVRSLVQCSFPYELVFHYVPPGQPVPPPGPAWATIVVDVTWTMTEYKPPDGLTFRADFALPASVTVTWDVAPGGIFPVPWPASPWTRAFASPETIQIRAQDEAGQKAEFDAGKARLMREAGGELAEFFNGWRPLVLPDPQR